MNIERNFIQKNKKVIVCEPSGRPYSETNVDHLTMVIRNLVKESDR